MQLKQNAELWYLSLNVISRHFIAMDTVVSMCTYCNIMNH